MKHSIVIVLVAVLVVACGIGCSAGGDGVWEPATSEGLTLTEASQRRIAGTYEREGLRVTFEATLDGDHQMLRIAARDGRVLVTGSVSPDARVLSLMDGRMTYARAASTSSFASPAPALATGDVPEPTGDANALSDLINAPEAAVLPWLSRELGARGVTGRVY